MLLCSIALKSLNSIERTLMSFMGATFNSNLCVIIISRYILTNISDETNITTVWNGSPSLAWHIPKHNVLIIEGDIYAHIGKHRNNESCLHNLPNRNGEYLADFSHDKNIAFLNTKFQKRRKIYGPISTKITL